MTEICSGYHVTVQVVFSINTNYLKDEHLKGEKIIFNKIQNIVG